jgi:hypothetical protein
MKGPVSTCCKDPVMITGRQFQDAEFLRRQYGYLIETEEFGGVLHAIIQGMDGIVRQHMEYQRFMNEESIHPKAVTMFHNGLMDKGAAIGNGNISGVARQFDMRIFFRDNGSVNGVGEVLLT